MGLHQENSASGGIQQGHSGQRNGAHIRQRWKRLRNREQRQRETRDCLEAVGMDLKEGLDGARRG